MIDTNTVNYAMNKITQAIGTVAPTVKNVSAAYVKYVVTQQVVFGMLCAIGTIVSLIIVIFSAKKAMVDCKNNSDDTTSIVLLTAFGFVLIVSFVCGIFEIPSAILALTNPEMFAVHQLINKGN